MSTDSDRTFRHPNLDATTGLSPEAYISVRSDRATLGISRRARRVMEAEPGAHLHLAFDRTRTAWVAVLDTPTDQGEPKIRDADPGFTIGSKLMARHLLEQVEEPGDDVVRFYLTGEEVYSSDLDATLHQLSPSRPDAELYLENRH